MNRGKGNKADHKPNTSPTKQHYVGVDELWQLFLSYVESRKSDPIKVEDWVGAAAKRVDRKREKPLTKNGFFLYVKQVKGCWVRHYFEKRSAVTYEPYREIIEMIEESIKDDQIVGAMCGIYNPTITARLNGLTEKVEESGSKEVSIKVTYDRKGNSPK